MPTIEKLQETWTSSSVTTLFRLCSKAEIDVSLPLQSPFAGFGWCLTMSRAPPVVKGFCNRQLKCHIFFSSGDCPSTWCSSPVKVTFSIPSRPNSSHAGGSTQSICTSLSLGGDKFLLSTHSIDDLGNAQVSLEVSFVNLQTRRLFNVLERVGLVPDAPVKAVGGVPLARTSLRTLEQSLKTGAPFDIIFKAYARRVSPGQVARLTPVYASTTMLHATAFLPDFSAKESLRCSSIFELTEEDEPPFTLEEYEYESDSDLDDEEPEGNNMTTAQSAEELLCRASSCHDRQSQTLDPDVQSHKDTTDRGSISSFSSFEEGPNNRTSLLECAETAVTTKMKVESRAVLVKGVAWKTWHAFVYYCYTGIINFSCLRSQIPTGKIRQSSSDDGSPHCSPKSMYRLARMLQVDALSQLAFDAIKTRLSSANILDEAFSKFTARHNAIREMEMDLLVKHRSAPDVLRDLPAKMEVVAMGNMPHAGQILAELYQRIAQMPSQK